MIHTDLSGMCVLGGEGGGDDKGTQAYIRVGSTHSHLISLPYN